jgi:hypothetical protein
MATPNVTRDVVIPFVCQSASIPNPITQFELLAILSLRNRARQLVEQVEEAEASVRVRLDSGATVEAGEHSACLRESLRRNVSWRHVAERLGDRLYGEDRGQAYCENVLKNTRPSRSISLTIL